MHIGIVLGPTFLVQIGDRSANQKSHESRGRGEVSSVREGHFFARTPYLSSLCLSQLSLLYMYRAEALCLMKKCYYCYFVYAI